MKPQAVWPNNRAIATAIGVLFLLLEVSGLLFRWYYVEILFPSPFYTLIIRLCVQTPVWAQKFSKKIYYPRERMIPMLMLFRVTAFQYNLVIIKIFPLSFSFFFFMNLKASCEYWRTKFPIILLCLKHKPQYVHFHVRVSYLSKSLFHQSLSCVLTPSAC